MSSLARRNGCTIGCTQCDGATRGPIPLMTGGPGGSCIDQGNSGPGPSTVKAGAPCAKQPARDASGKPCGAEAKALNCDPRSRTVNRGAKCGAADDYYYYSPWRAPGDAPVFDACGLAGGNHEANPTCGYDTSPNAKLGDKGSSLNATAPVVFKRGSHVEVAWNLQANHGGGYIYRLCDASEPLTEECFRRTPLAFEGRSSFRWNGVRRLCALLLALGLSACVLRRAGWRGAALLRRRLRPGLAQRHLGDEPRPAQRHLPDRHLVPTVLRGGSRLQRAAVDERDADQAGHELPLLGDLGAVQHGDCGTHTLASQFWPACFWLPRRRFIGVPMRAGHGAHSADHQAGIVRAWV